MNILEKMRILVVEHNPDDIKAIKRVVRRCDINCEPYFALDGEEALDALARKGRFEDMTGPDLILMSINLPKIDGLAVLSMIKEDERLRRVPVIILTVSEHEEDMVKAYDIGAASYMVKPIDPEEFKRLTETISAYWQFVGRVPE